jgi:hypothetical protein
MAIEFREQSLFDHSFRPVFLVTRGLLPRIAKALEAMAKENMNLSQGVRDSFLFCADNPAIVLDFMRRCATFLLAELQDFGSEARRGNATYSSELCKQYLDLTLMCMELDRNPSHQKFYYLAAGAFNCWLDAEGFADPSDDDLRDYFERAVRPSLQQLRLKDKHLPTWSDEEFVSEFRNFSFADVVSQSLTKLNAVLLKKRPDVGTRSPKLLEEKTESAKPEKKKDQGFTMEM